MFVLLFALWILFNGKITLEICLFGLVISGAIYLFAIKLLDYDPKKELKALKKLGGIFHFPVSYTHLTAFFDGCTVKNARQLRLIGRFCVSYHP